MRIRVQKRPIGLRRGGRIIRWIADLDHDLDRPDDHDECATHDRSVAGPSSDLPFDP